jgi:long-chain acyl-CoA synthetase
MKSECLQSVRAERGSFRFADARLRQNRHLLTQLLFKEPEASPPTTHAVMIAPGMETTHQAGTAEVTERPAALDAATLCEAFQWTASERASSVALRTPGEGTSITFAEYAERVRAIAGGLAGLGVGRGDTVALMLLNRPEFHLVDTATLHLGATPFSVYNTSTADQIQYLFGNARNSVVVTEPGFLPVLRDVKGIEHVVLVEGDEAGTLPIARLEQSAPAGFDFEAAWRAVQPEDVATLIYTSGTTGPPKGVELTHTSLMAEVRSMVARLPTSPGGRSTSFLPSAHIADRWASHYQGSIVMGNTITSIADPRTVVAHLPEVRPTVWGSVPRVWEKLKAALEAQGIANPAALSEDQKATIRERLGLDQCEALVVGAAPTPIEVLAFFGDLGLEICEVWGMSETSCCATCNPPGAVKLGTCGPAVDACELSLADDRELLVRGDLVMKGYRADPAKTREAIDDDGWLHTGDVAEIDEHGYLKIVDRKKELIINATGKNMSPANIEARLKSSHPLIGQAVAIGDRRPYNVALIVLDPDACGAFAREHALDDGSPASLASDERVQSAVAAAVDEANSHLSRVEQIKRFEILPAEWEPGGLELTPTMKLKRRPIAERYAEEIEALYR